LGKGRGTRICTQWLPTLITNADDQELENLLAKLAKDFKHKESITQSLDNTDDEMLDEVNNALDGEGTLTEAEQAKIAAGIRPVTLVLAKVREPLCP
jgi:peptidoglycan hydrolase CwlO-like protein